MAYDEKTKRSNHENCATHTWPRHRGGGSISAAGNIEHQQCNNCLALRIIFTADVLIGGEWRRVTDTQIVEPDFTENITP